MTDVITLLLVVGAIATTTLALRRSSGRSHVTSETFSPADLRRIGAGPTGTRFVLFTAPGCSPCTVARRVLDDAAARHAADVVSVDVTVHEQLARDKQVWRAPTVFVVDASGRALTRISGVPRPETLDEALAGQPALA